MGSYCPKIVMKVVITAGGKGERLRPLTDNIPKPMVSVQGKPVIEHIIEHLKGQGFDDFILTLCYKGQVIKDYFRDGSKFGIKVNYTWEDEENPLGTAGGVGLARDMLDSTFLVTCGDALRSLDASGIINLHKKKNAFATMALHRPGNEKITSIVKFDSNWKLSGFVERPTPEQLAEADDMYMNSSFFVLEPGIFKYIPVGQKVDFSYNVWPEALNNGERVFVYPTDDYVLDVGTPEKLEEAQKWSKVK